MERVLGIDYGDSKVGIAVNDELNITAVPVITIMYKGNQEQLFNELTKIIEKYTINRIVVGKPLNMNGTSGFRVEATNKFIDILKDRFKLEVETVDERLTTNYSNRIMNEINVKSKKRKQIEDTMSAVYILETYMERQKKMI